MTFNTKVGGLVMAALLVFGAGSVASAQVISSPSSCVVFNNNFGYGAYDYSSSNAVSNLQNFLVGQGYFGSAYLGTGHYGAITLRAVAQFQAAHGVPSTGYVGPLTRALIQNISCGTNPVPTPTPTSSVSLYNESPTSGAVGTTVSITGFGFTSSNTILMDGSVAASNVPISSSIAIACTTNPSCHGGINQTLTFTIPNSLAPYCAPGTACPMYMRLLTPGQYNITVLNQNGTSNALSFTVTSGSTGGSPLSINGLNAPASLALGQSGTWTVSATSNAGTGNLQYSVVWGDEATIYNGSVASSPISTVQSSATFTHTYQRAGNYTPVFTVTDSTGHSVSTSATVVITPLY
jgi:hypothetical protein